MESHVVRIVDGDTIVGLEANKNQHRVRLAGIYSPERGQPFGRRAKQNLARLDGRRIVSLWSTHPAIHLHQCLDHHLQYL